MNTKNIFENLINNAKILKLGTAALCAALPLSILAQSDTITITGSTTVLPISQKTAELFMEENPGTKVTVSGGGSGVGIAAIMNKTASIGQASRSVKDKEVEEAKKNGVNIFENVVGLDAIAIAVNKKVPVIDLSLDQLRDIFTGKIDNWSQVGGPNQKIIVISRDVASGTFEVFKELVLKGEKVKGDALMLAANKAVATTVAKTKGAIGYIGLAFLDKKLNAVAVDGVSASPDNARNGSYKLSRKLYMYTDGQPTGKLKQYLDFVLSPKGQKIVNDVGYISVK